MLKYFTLNTILEWLCFLIACICLIKDRNLVWRSMIILLLLTCITETTGIYIRNLYMADPVNIAPNVWVYNILLIFQAGFISAMFASLLKEYLNATPMILLGLVLLAVLYVYEVFTHGVFKKHTLTTIVMSVLFVIYSFYYFYNLLKDERYVNLKYSPAFWWVVGILFFYFGAITINLFYEKIRDLIVTPKRYITYIFYVLNMILYACMSYSFICKKWLTKTSET